MKTPKTTTLSSSSPGLSSNHRGLTPDSALQIFALRPGRSEDDQTFVPSTRLSHAIANHFDIGDRTIRDIWNRRVWARVTMPFWTQAERASDPRTCSTLNAGEKVVPAKSRSQGRPRGARDTVRRSKGSTSTSSSEPQTSVATEEASTLPMLPTDSTVENVPAALDAAHAYQEDAQTSTSHEQQEQQK
eukprot:3802680-Rhodomonas_salina.2